MEALSRTNARRISVHGQIYLDGLDGVRDVSCADQAVSFLYSGDIRHLLRRLSESSITDLSISEPDLEEIFLHFYEKAGDRT